VDARAVAFQLRDDRRPRSTSFDTYVDIDFEFFILSITRWRKEREECSSGWSWKWKRRRWARRRRAVQVRAVQVRVQDEEVDGAAPRQQEAPRGGGVLPPSIRLRRDETG
jgi:hypothetical protein